MGRMLIRAPSLVEGRLLIVQHAVAGGSLILSPGMTCVREEKEGGTVARKIHLSFENFKGTVTRDYKTG